MKRLEHVLQRLREYKLVAKLDKCQFGRESIPYLGHIIDSRGIRVDPGKTEAISKIADPTTVTELRSFLGMTGYYRRFIPDYADIAEPLFQLLKKKKVFEWSEEQSMAVQTLKRKLLTAPVLMRPDYGKPFTISCDASDVGIGAVLEQEGEDGQLHPIMYWSKTLNSAERNYQTTDRECLAIVKAIHQFRHYVYGSQFTVVTDHQALKWLQESQGLSGRLQRWALKLQGHNMLIKYRKGKDHGNADGLSRLGHGEPIRVNQIFETNGETGGDPTSSSSTEWDERLKQYGIGDAWDIIDLPAQDRKALQTRRGIRDAQQTERWTRALWKALFVKENPGGPVKLTPEEEKVLTDYKIEDFKLIDGLLYKIHRTSKEERKKYVRRSEIIHQLVIPETMRDEYMRQIHDIRTGGGHLGMNKCYDKLRNRYFWPGMYKDMEDWIKRCQFCQRRKTPRRSAPTQPNLRTTRPFECIGIDVLGPLPTSSTGFRYVIVFVDHFTGWVEAFPMRKNDAKTCAKLLVTQVICRYGTPEKILTDRGGPFIGTLAQEVYKLMNTVKLNTTAYHPQTNGKVERFNSTLVAMMAMYVGLDQKDWDVQIPYCVFAYNTSRHEQNEFSPYYLLFGRTPTLPVDTICRVDSATYQTSGEYAREIIKRMRISHRLAIRNQREIANAYREKSLAGPPIQFKKGELVMMQFFSKTFGLARKLALMWRVLRL